MHFSFVHPLARCFYMFLSFEELLQAHFRLRSASICLGQHGIMSRQIHLDARGLKSRKTVFDQLDTHLRFSESGETLTAKYFRRGLEQIDPMSLNSGK